MSGVGRQMWLHTKLAVRDKKYMHSQLFFYARIRSGQGLGPRACLVSAPARLWIDPHALLITHPLTL